VQQLIAVAGAEHSTVRVAFIVFPFKFVDLLAPATADCRKRWKQIYLNISRRHRVAHKDHEKELLVGNGRLRCKK
jgi:hypothetical protein